MWALAAARNFENSQMNSKKNNSLEEENIKLQEELEFYKRISEFPNSLVGNMYVKYSNGKKVWVDRQNIVKDTKLLESLDKDSDVLEWIENKNIKFKDNDW